MQRKTTLGKTARVLAVLLVVLLIALPASSLAAPPAQSEAPLAPDAVCTGNATDQTNTNVTNPGNATGAPDNAFAQLYESGDQIVLTLGTNTLSVGSTYSIRWRLNTGSAVTVTVEESTDNSTWGAATDSPFSVSNTDFFDQNITASRANGTRYLRITTTNANNLDLDAVSFRNAPCITGAAGQIDGNVFRDYNANAVRDTGTAFLEPPVAGVEVRAYDAAGSQVGATSITDANGNYVLSGLTDGTQYRVEFTLPTDGSLDYLKPGAAGGTTVQFVTPPASRHVGFNNPSDYSQTNPPIVTARTAFGPRSALGAWSPGATDNTNESVIGIPFTADGDLSPSNAHSVYATLKQTGTLYGIAYQRTLKLALAGTFFKSHADTGPKITGQGAGTQWEWLNDVDPLGAVYAVNTATPLGGNPADIPAASNARVYANLNKIIDPSTGLVVPGNPAGVDPRRSGGINYDTNSCGGTGDGGAPADGNSCWVHDPVAFQKVGTIGLGDVEADDAEQFIFVVNLGDKKLYQLPFVPYSTTAWPVKTLAAPPVAIPSTCGSDAVPGGLGFKDGKLYVGVTCTAQSTNDPNQLKAEVWQFDPLTQTFGGSPVFSLDLDYPRGCIFAGYGANQVGLEGINAPKNRQKSATENDTTGVGILTSNCQTYKDNTPAPFDNANWNPWPKESTPGAGDAWKQAFENNKGINSYGKPGHPNTDAVQVEHPLPWLSDISFDGNDLVLGFRDSFGDRSGNDVRSPNVSINTTLNSLPPQVVATHPFDTISYSTGTGWSADWTETNDTANTVGTGDIQVVADVSNYQLRVAGPNRSVQRPTTSFSAGVGTLSFAYRRDGLDDANDKVEVQISTNGGTNWTTVATLAGPTNDAAYRTAILDINTSNNMVLRFLSNTTDVNDRVYFDNVRITNASRTWMSQYVYGSGGTAPGSYDGAGFGDLLRACRTGSSWTLENNGECGGVTTPGKDNGQGPGTATTYPDPPYNINSPFTGYGEWYWDDSGPGSRNPASAIEYFSFGGVTWYRGHEQTMMGGTFQQSGWPDIAVTIADQAGFGDGGVARFSNVVEHPDISRETNGNLVTSFGVTPEHPEVLSNGIANPNDNDAGVALRHTQLYGATTGFFGKANGLGDIEGLMEPAPIEIGNRVWIDNGNGRQDPGETTLNAVVVELWKDTDSDGIANTKVAQTTTNINGNYLFSFNGNPRSPNTENWTFTTDKAVLPNTVYEIRIDRNQVALTGNSFPTVANAEPEQRDSDAVTIPDTGGTGRTIAGLRFTTGGPGNNDHTYDFGFYENDEVLNLGNQVWFDANNNGLLDGTEAGINGVKVDLYADSNGDGVLTIGSDTYLGTTTTATVSPNAGIYNFINLLPGNYIVHLPQSNFGTGQPLNGMASSTGNNPTPDPDVEAPTNPNFLIDDNGYHLPGNGVASLAVTLSAGGEPNNDGDGTDGNLTVDFGFFGLGAIGNYVWVDENSDGYQDAGEPGIPNVQVNLYDNNGNLVATTYTDSHGGYLFDNLKPGSYFVDIVEATLPAGMSQTPFNLPGADFGNQDQSTGTNDYGYPVNIGFVNNVSYPLENLTADFGYNYNPDADVNNPPTGDVRAALGDRVWIDADADGRQDPEEIGVPNVCVDLIGPGPDGIFGNGDDQTLSTTTTNASGYYLFDGLAAGAYVAQVCASNFVGSGPLVGYTQTGDPDHFATTATGPANNDNKTTVPVVLGPGDVFLNADFGYQPATCGKIGDTIWFDADADGSGPLLVPVIGGAPVIQGNGAQNDSLEWGIAGVTVALIRDSNENGAWDAGEPIIGTATTNASGQYVFPCLPIADGEGTDDYIVWVNDTDNVLGEMVPTYDKDGKADPGANGGTDSLLGISSVANLGPTPVLDQDFGYTNTYQQLNPQNPAQPLGLIGDYVWLDADRQNDQDEPNAGVEGVVVELLNSTGNTVIATTTTDENGYYSFGGLALNTSYIVRVAASNFAAGAPLAGTTNTGGPAGGSGNAGPVVNLTPANPVNLVQDFGYAAPTGQGASLGNLVWLDSNANGLFDGVDGPGTDPNAGADDNEPEIGGVTIDLYRDLNGNGRVDAGEPLVGTQTTASPINAGLYGADGTYIFTGLPAGTYVVNVTDTAGLLAGYWHSLGTANTSNNSQVDPYALSVAAAGTNLTADFGYYVEPACVGNFVWYDQDGDGIQDTTEPGLNSVKTTLAIAWPNTTSSTLNTVTGDDPNTSGTQLGWYSFCNLLLDEDYRIGSSTTASQPNQPAHVISVDTTQSALATYVTTQIQVGSNPKIDSNDPAGTVGVPVQGLTNVNQLADANTEQVIASYDFGFRAADWGDLPDSYNTLSSNNGAVHLIDATNPTPLLGTCEDSEVNGQPISTAFGDDDNNSPVDFGGTCTDDEDGVAAVNNWTDGTGHVNVTVSGATGCLNAWMDFTNGSVIGQNGVFGDTLSGVSEWIIQNLVRTAGTGMVTFPLPNALPAGNYYLRFRLTPVNQAGACDPSAYPNSTPTWSGAAKGGEVEDYQVNTTALAVALASFNAAAQSDHVLVTWETVSELDSAGFNLYRSLSANGELSLLGYLPSPTPGSSVGAAYSYQDFDVATGQTYWYWLEAVDLSGATTMYEPVVVTFQVPTAVTASELTASSATTVSLGWLAAAVLLVAGLAAGLTWRRRSVR